MIHELIRRLFGVSETVALGNTLVDWITAVLIFVGVYSLLMLIRRAVASRYTRFTGAQHSLAVRMIAYLAGHTKQFVFLAVALYAAEAVLELPPRLHIFSSNAVVILLLLQVGLWAASAVQFYLQFKQTRVPEDDRSFTSSLEIIRFVSMTLIWALVTLLALDNLGVNITALLAGLGVGGVAVALALQNVLGDLFASLAIALDKPFVVGDNLNIDTCTGVVERIGIKSTRLRSETGETIILSNADILKSRIRNLGPHEERRALLTLNLAHETPMDALRDIPKLVETAVRAESNARFDRCYMKAVGEWSLQFEVTFFTRDVTTRPLPDLTQAVNFQILDAMRQRDIKLALAPGAPPAKA